MPDLYNTSYVNNESDVYSAVRVDTYGLDLGQTSWASMEELAEIPRRLQIDPAHRVLDIGCGAGGCALHFAKTIGCRVTGIDMNEQGVRTATESARRQGLADRATFQVHDASTPLPFDDETFHAVYANDSFCHIPNRMGLLRECRRVLKPGGRLFFSDALVITGVLTSKEIATRSSIGFYLFLPRGENERLAQQAGLIVASALDTTQQAAGVAQRWSTARDRRRPALANCEGEANFEGLQQFLACVHTLTAEKRLERWVYVAARE
jgi:SAM-dependent methyltransferase